MMFCSRLGRNADSNLIRGFATELHLARGQPIEIAAALPEPQCAGQAR
jgi:hypothetical protein